MRYMLRFLINVEQCEPSAEIYLHSLGSIDEALKIYEEARENPHTDSHTKKKGLSLAGLILDILEIYWSR